MIALASSAVVPGGGAADGQATGGRPADRAAPERATPELPFYSNIFGKMPSAAAMTAVGRELFRDTSLSASGKTACATCHNPERALLA